MTKSDSFEQLLDEDWSATWDSLPDAPDLVPRAKSAQITLRIPISLLARIRAVADAMGLPYHSLARAWMVEALRTKAPVSTEVPVEELQAAQLNIKMDHEVLDDLKTRAAQLGRPYHRLARQWVEAALAREERALGLAQVPTPPIKDMMVLLLHSPASGGGEAIRGMTRLQKLLFVIEQKLASSDSRFYAFNYGPFNEEVNDAAEALRLEGFLSGVQPIKPGMPSFAEMIESAERLSGPRDPGSPEEFALTPRGHEAAERLRQSSEAYQRLFEYVSEVRRDWDTPNLNELIHRVYETWPKYAEKSKIRELIRKRPAGTGED
jgi:predicted DNA binding CopG/RHH family protein